MGRCSVGEGLKAQVQDLERRLIFEALEKTGGVQSKAAKELRVSERVLRYKMKKYGLKLETKLSHEDIFVD
jgi:transcriptional regulator with GAF, ATPase, and Fis domain